MANVDMLRRAARVLSEPAYQLWVQGRAWKERYPRCAFRFHRELAMSMDAQRPFLWRLRRAYHRAAARRWRARAKAAGLLPAGRS